MATLTLRGNAWCLNWSDPKTGERHRRVIGSRSSHSETDATTALKALEYQLATGDQVLNLGQDRNQDRTTFRELAASYLAWRHGQFPDSQDGIDLIVNVHLVPFLTDKPLALLSSDNAEDYVTKRAAEVQPSTLNKELRTLKAILNKAVEWKLLAANPVHYVKGRQEIESKPREFYTADELQRLYTHSSTEVEGAMWKLMANTGMRRSEALALRDEHVSANSITIVSTTASRTKSRKWRHVPLSSGAKQALNTLKHLKTMHHRNMTAGHVFPRLQKASLTKAFERTADRAGLDGSLHVLRHTFASHLVMAGRPLYEVQQLLGHANIKTTQQYAHLAPDYLQDAVKGMNL